MAAIALAVAERTVQDTANVTSTTANGAQTASGIANYLPGPTVQRGLDHLEAAHIRLKDHVLPLEMETEFYNQHDQLYAKGEHLDEQINKIAAWKQITLIPHAHRFERKATALRRQVKKKSHWYESMQTRRHIESVHTLDGWEVTDMPVESPALPPINSENAETISIIQPLAPVLERANDEEVELCPLSPPSGGASSSTDAEGTASSPSS